MPSETIAEERGMAQHIRDNRDQIRLDAAREVAEKIQGVLYSHGLGNFKYEPTDMEILVRHIVAASEEWRASRWWNEPEEGGAPMDTRPPRARVTPHQHTERT